MRVMGAVKVLFGTTAVTVVALILVPVGAATLPNRTFCVLLSPVPVMVTTVPGGPPAGEKLVTLGPTRKLLVVMATPPGEVTCSVPSTAPAGTTACIFVPDTTV